MSKKAGLAKHKFLLGELFCGPGGLALGAISSVIKNKTSNLTIGHSWANDYDEDTCKTYAHNICPKSPETVICEDVRKLNIEKLPEIDAFAYGFPCNDFSIVGKQKGFDGEFGPLYTYGVKIINKFRPKFFIAENVGGLRNANEGKAFKKILHDLRSSGNGYELTTNLYKSEEYGVPQTRHRIIIVGIDKKYGMRFEVPAPTTKGDPITTREAFENPIIQKDAPNNDFTKVSDVVIERLKLIKPGQNVWNADLPQHLKLNVKGAKLSQIYKRLDPNKPSYTLTGSGGGGTHGYHYEHPRPLTNRERARIQTFPDWFTFIGSRESVRKQIGMAVPVKLSNIIFTSVLKMFAHIDYPSTKPSVEEETQEVVF